jgi:hypothetical protein
MLGGFAVRMLIATIIGAATGLFVYSVSQISGRYLFVVTGAITGAATVAVLQLYNRAARLTEVKVTVPQLTEFTFLVNNDSRQVAWRLFVETVTRISTQPLADDEGLIREALSSLYGLFATTRDTLKAGRPSVAATGAQTVEHLAVTLLNLELRPFLSKWHPRLRAYEMSSPEESEAMWPQAAECRDELREVQQRVQEYALAFARLAAVPDAEAMLAATTGR